MEFYKLSALSIFLIFGLTMASGYPPRMPPNKGGYWRSWSQRFPPSAIDTTFFTHIYYAFLEPNNTTFTFDIDNPTALLLENFTTTLHAKSPPVKTMFSIGGAGAGSTLFSRIASCHGCRKSFIVSSIEVARKFGFHGMDLDWESPRDPQDMVNFGRLLHHWRAAVKKEAKATGRPELLLSAATYFSVDFFLDAVYRKYPVASINKNLDWINAMCYDYHGSWDVSATGAHAALYDPKSNISTSYGIQSWLEAKIEREKLVMGMPIYGRSWRLKDPNVHGIGAPAVDVGPGNHGVLDYFAIEKFNMGNNASSVFDLSTVSVYSVAGTTWIGFDDVRSVTMKVEYAQASGLGGYFFWAVDGDYNSKISKRASEAWIL